MRKVMKNFWKDESGQSVVEYIIVIAGFVAVTVSILAIFKSALGKDAQGVKIKTAALPGTF